MVYYRSIVTERNDRTTFREKRKHSGFWKTSLLLSKASLVSMISCTRSGNWGAFNKMQLFMKPKSHVTLCSLKRRRSHSCSANSGKSIQDCRGHLFHLKRHKIKVVRISQTEPIYNYFASWSYICIYIYTVHKLYILFLSLMTFKEPRVQHKTGRCFSSPDACERTRLELVTRCRQSIACQIWGYIGMGPNIKIAGKPWSTSK